MPAKMPARGRHLQQGTDALLFWIAIAIAIAIAAFSAIAEQASAEHGHPGTPARLADQRLPGTWPSTPFTKKLMPRRNLSSAT